MSKYKSLITLAILFCGCADVPRLPPVPTAAPEVAQVAPEASEATDESSQPVESPQATTEIQAADGEIIGLVTRIIDGDTIDVLKQETETIRIRLNGIDAPEMGQPFGRTAKEFLNDSIGTRIVRIVPRVFSDNCFSRLATIRSTG